MRKEFVAILLAILIAPAVGYAQTESETSESASKSSAGEFSFGVNLVPSLQNDDISDTPVDGLIDDASYGFQANYAFPSEEKVIFKFLNVQEYISLRALKFLSRGESEGVEYAESLQALGVVYGQRYFLADDFEGVAFGWYAGGAYMPSVVI